MRTDTLESHSAINSTSPQLCVRLPRRQNSEPADRILRELAEFYPVSLRGSSVQIAVDRGRAAEAPLRVATILDDIDMTWEEHFHLPELGSPKLCG